MDKCDHIETIRPEAVVNISGNEHAMADVDLESKTGGGSKVPNTRCMIFLYKLLLYFV